MVALKAEDGGSMFFRNTGTHIQAHSVTNRKTIIEMFTTVRTPTSLKKLVYFSSANFTSKFRAVAVYIF
jgi:hypothetical protein